MSTQEPSTSYRPQTGCVDLETSIDTYCTYLSKFQFDKARDFCEEQRLTQAAHVSSKQWQCLVANLSQLALNESHYFSLVFFSSKFSFRKDNQVREAYVNVKNELEYCYEECDKSTETNENNDEFKEFLRQLICLCTIRSKLVEFYVFLVTDNWHQTIEESEKHLNMIKNSMEKVLGDDIKLPQLKSIEIELKILTGCFKIQSDLLNINFIDSLIQLKQLAQDLNTWFSHVPFKTSTSKPNFLFFNFAKSSKNTPKLLLLHWFSKFYNTLLAKLCLYGHELFVSHLNSNDVKSLLNAQPSFIQSIVSYSRRVNSAMICLLLDRMDNKEPFYGFGYQNALTKYGKDNIGPLTGRHGMYPALCRFPNDQKLFDTLHPSIISLIQDTAENSDERIRFYYDLRANTTYFTVLVEKNVHLSVVLNRKVSEKDQTIQLMFTDLLHGLRLISLIHDLRQSHKN
ncbi:unnamed protein product [Bursaphelenchus okinawaensis]|uniref:Uncharacterized protein n=1 Tax=Bursaphelenchus okinawaensis TaxID=465554 RepID=A0A811LMC2_9BILA|nr:unnamed protein product [Bursaphelenchus okinawaensis]CAG9124076.1 unnamed protein product [Bursaphelenchus okinawaensis]